MSRVTDEINLVDRPLAGARIWLSGCLPEGVDAMSEVGQKILEFVGDFADRVFDLGGTIFHGAHPDFTPVLLNRLRMRYGDVNDKRYCLELCVAEYFSKQPNLVPIDEWKKECQVYTIRGTEENSDLADSLLELRGWMNKHASAIVVIGGKSSPKSGVEIELKLAINRGIAAFVVGGFGGAAGDIVKTKSRMLYTLRNGFDRGYNVVRIGREDDPWWLAEKIVDQLTRLPLVIR